MADERRDLAPPSWDELVDMARYQVRLAEEGNTLVAKQIVALAAQALRGVLTGHEPDPERRIYLDYLARALEQVGDGVDARKALGVWTDTRRHTASPSRDATIYLAVGLELDRLRQASEVINKPVDAAIKRVARHLKLGPSVVGKVWRLAGGEDAWKEACANEDQSLPK